jgi:SAM-dependent methyltransferase
MSELAERLCRHYYGNTPHPYRIFEERVQAYLPTGGALLDAGCGRTAPVLQKFRGLAGRLVGADLVEFTDVPPDMELYNTDLAHLPVASDSIDLVMSRSVFEHLERPAEVYRELARVLKPGGKVVFLTANVWDYATMIARIVPNRFHAQIVAHTEGRAEEDVFPTCYKTNSKRSVMALACKSGFEVSEFAYLGQYPNYFMFNGALFFLGTCYDKLVTRFEALRALRGWILVTLTKSAPHGTAE